MQKGIVSLPDSRLKLITPFNLNAQVYYDQEIEDDWCVTK